MREIAIKDQTMHVHSKEHMITDWLKFERTPNNAHAFKEHIIITIPSQAVHETVPISQLKVINQSRNPRPPVKLRPPFTL